MKKNVFVSKNIRKQKKIYYLLIGLALLGIIAGLLFIFLLNEENKILLSTKIREYFDSDISLSNNFFKCLFNNIIFIILIWVLGISIIGIPIVLMLLLYKSFIFGFSISSLISTFGIKGLLISLLNIIVSKSIYLIVLILISFYSVSFSIKLLKSFFTKSNIEFKDSIKKYLSILLLSISIGFFISIYEGIISIYLLNFFY